MTYWHIMMRNEKAAYGDFYSFAEIEGNINWAENRCNDLTDCLDNLKNYYGYQKNEGFKLCTPQINKKTGTDC